MKGTQNKTEIEARHWEELSQVALQFSEYWARYDSWPYPNPATQYGYILEGDEFEAFDSYLADCLLSHLKAEFPEFAKIEKWKELLDITKVTPELTRKFHFVGHRRMFQGTCPLCENYTVAVPRVKMKEVIEAYVAENRAGWTEVTMSNYLSLLTRFAEAHEMLPTEPGQIQDFLSSWKDRTRFIYFKILKPFYTFASGKFGVPNVTASMKAPKVKKTEPDFLDTNELQQLFNVKHSLRDYAALLALFSSALRVGEVAILKFSYIHDSYLIVPKEGKTGSRRVALMPEAKEALLALKDGHKDNDHIFWAEHPHAPLKVAGFQSLVKKAFERAGLPADKAHPHTLRHSYTEAAIKQGSNSAICQQVLGHSNIQTTQLYTHLSQNTVIDQALKFNPLLGINPSLSPKNPSLSPLDNGISQ